MEKLEILNSKARKEIENAINSQFGCSFKLDFGVFMNTKNRIFILNRDVKKIDIDELRINSLGLYFGEFSHNEMRLSMDASQVIGPIAKKNVLEVTEEEASRWMAGEDFPVNTAMDGFVIIKDKEDFLGCGRIVNGTLLNYVPKERRS